MSAEMIFNALRQSCGDNVTELVAAASPFIVVKNNAIRDVAQKLKTMGFDSLMCLSGLDTKGMKASTLPGTPALPAPPEELAVVYHLCASSTGEKIALRVALDRAAPNLPSISDIWLVANWHEREAFDMFGIIFTGHPKLERLLCPDDWIGHPLRKDYQMPTGYRGMPHENLVSGGERLHREEQGKS